MFFKSFRSRHGATHFDKLGRVTSGQAIGDGSDMSVRTSSLASTTDRVRIARLYAVQVVAWVTLAIVLRGALFAGPPNGADLVGLAAAMAAISLGQTALLRFWIIPHGPSRRAPES
jgi:hypothetical protein